MTALVYVCAVLSYSAHLEFKSVSEDFPSYSFKAGCGKLLCWFLVVTFTSTYMILVHWPFLFVVRWSMIMEIFWYTGHS